MKYQVRCYESLFSFNLTSNEHAETLNNLGTKVSHSDFSVSPFRLEITASNGQLWVAISLISRTEALLVENGPYYLKIFTIAYDFYLLRKLHHSQ